MLGDLHCHSIYSDGSVLPEQLCKFALRHGLSHIALTDHDTLNGLSDLKAAAQKTELQIIPGVECTTKDPYTGRSVHVLCYAPANPKLLLPLIQETSRKRRESKLAMAEKIEKLYPLFKTEDCIFLARKSTSIFESHIMRALANAGYTNQPFGPLLKELIGKQGSCYVPISYPNTLEVIDLMHQAGGIVVIAHPGQFDSVELCLQLAKEQKIDGIECMHYKNSPEVQSKCLSIAEQYHLLITGGSDFHGMYSASPHPVGFCTTDDLNMHRLLNLINV